MSNFDALMDDICEEAGLEEARVSSGASADLMGNIPTFAKHIERRAEGLGKLAAGLGKTGYADRMNPQEKRKVADIAKRAAVMRREIGKLLSDLDDVHYAVKKKMPKGIPSH